MLEGHLNPPWNEREFEDTDDLERLESELADYKATLFDEFCDGNITSKEAGDLYAKRRQELGL